MTWYEVCVSQENQIREVEVSGNLEGAKRRVEELQKRWPDHEMIFVRQHRQNKPFRVMHKLTVRQAAPVRRSPMSLRKQVQDGEAFELQLDEDARRLFGNMQEGEGQHSEALDIALIKASFRNLLKWAVPPVAVPMSPSSWSEDDDGAHPADHMADRGQS